MIWKLVQTPDSLQDNRESHGQRFDQRVPPEVTKISELAPLEREIEKAATEIGHLINGAQPEDRESLREFAHAVINQEALLVPAEAGGQPADAGKGGFNPFGLGIILMIAGGGLAFLFGPLGLLVAMIGLLSALGGVAQVIFKRR